jgi:hypothetical protein
MILAHCVCDSIAMDRKQALIIQTGFLIPIPACAFELMD